MKQIPLSKGTFALVDDEDFEELNKHKWFNNYGYAVRNVVIPNSKRRRLLPMHRVVAKTPNGLFTDHINGNGLDNQKNNLRFCTTAQNIRNRGLAVNNKSGYKGVHFSKSTNRWIAQIRIPNRKTQLRLGSFKTVEEGYAAYCDAAKKYHGDFANVNNTYKRQPKAQ